MTKKKITNKPLEEDKSKIVELPDDELDSVTGGAGLGDIPRGPITDPGDFKDKVK